MPPPSFLMFQNLPPPKVGRVLNWPPQKIGRVQKVGEFRGDKFGTLQFFRVASFGLWDLFGFWDIGKLGDGKNSGPP